MMSSLVSNLRPILQPNPASSWLIKSKSWARNLGISDELVSSEFSVSKVVPQIIAPVAAIACFYSLLESLFYSNLCPIVCMGGFGSVNADDAILYPVTIISLSVTLIIAVWVFVRDEAV
ncbi:hypothetical protein [Jiella mangrovi]|uniref:Uncharacterized protein n=1 Tax=Jiella mangrovi TaxID=2821407 RepID=A0ABS4BHE9_9HYPH|nr:hypothetical protein [Jiella mangrovi]MBP0616166.1 hypothetical protein [Jiella mangrovi]